ncbi:MAG: lysophospholipid acyltransferase family protein [Armatimonadota bacterium]|nr:lysophospholipid acyltransferase family protein [Armatimonadota bacterium]
MLLYYVAWFLLRAIILPVFGRWRVIGRCNIPRTGGVVLAPNHISYADPPVVGAASRRQVRFMAKSELFAVPIFGALIRAVGAFPVKQATADRAALKQAISLLETGEVVCIFPEGTRSPGGTLLKAELGISMIAMKSRAPIIPVALLGSDKLLPPHSPFLRFAKVRVRIGKPVHIDDLYDRGSDRDALEEIGRRVMAAIAELKGEGL